MNPAKILVCTVGTGDVSDLVRSLLNPLKKSIADGVWGSVVLLPSSKTAENAERLRDEIAGVPIESRPLPAVGQEEDADACFAHFDAVFAALIDSGTPPEQIVADFTRGTKAMSAALVLAAVGRRIPTLRYVTGTQRDARGMVVPGSEIVSSVRTTVATARRDLDDALLLIQHGDFAAVAAWLAEDRIFAWPQALHAEAQSLRRCAEFLACWDRLDFRSAAAVGDSLPESAPSSAAVFGFSPPTEVRDWVQKLADEREAKARPSRKLLVDLFANAERRLHDHHYEDALLRAYRVLELLGQVRLFDRGYNTAELLPDDPCVRAFQDKLIKKNSQPLSSDRANGLLLAAREQAARFLKHLGDPFGQKLLDAAKVGEVPAERRNKSILIHGFDPVAGARPEPLRQLLDVLESLIRYDIGPDADSFLRLARFPSQPRPSSST